MSVDGWRTALVLGGIRSGKSEFAESLVDDATSVRYVATAAHDADDPEWSARIEAHQQRRPDGWTTEEIGAEPDRLVELIQGSGPDETLLVDDLGGWVTARLGSEDGALDALRHAVEDCRARLVVVSPEVGLSLVPTTEVGRAFADALGETNRAVADACDAVVLVVAGQPSWLKRTAATERPVPLPEVLTPSPTPEPEPEPERADPLTAPTMMLPMVATGLVIQPGMDLPMPDEYAGPQATDRLGTLDIAGAGLGALDQVVTFAAATQGTAAPVPWRSVRVLLLHGDHDGGAAAGAAAGESTRRADQARAGEGALARLAAEAGASLQVVDAPTAAPIELGPALTADAVEAALRYGWRLAEEAVDSGVDLIVLAACGAGTEAAAAAVLAANAGAEPAAVLGRVVGPGGRIDDASWMTRCAAVRDAMHRTRDSQRTAKDVLAELGGGDVAIATGVLLGATARRTPVLLDGPVGVAAGLVSRDLAGQARHWCLLPDHGGHPAVRLAADVLGLSPLLDLRLDLGEGATSLAALPLLRAALGLAGTLPAHPALAANSA
jgi:nicotinate-nucleotide--dimethylbenzimidazole phosphoribosyltransferase